MARPFYVPEDDQEQQGSSQPPSGSSSVTQSPLQSPLMVNNEHLVQAFCEALYRIGGGTPAFPLPPPSPSCSPHATPQSTAGHYGEIFFPRSISTPRTPRTYTHQPLEEVHRVPSHPIEQQRLPIRRNSGISVAPTQPLMQSTCNPTVHGRALRSISTPRTPRTYTHQPLEEVHRVPSHPIEQQRLPIRRIRLTSTGEDEDDYPSDHDGSLNDFQEHFHHLEARERLTEFPGRVPDRKKGKSLPPPPAADPETPKDKPKEQCFNWSLVTALFIVVGCGIFASR
uniref:Uncharacterized protein n=2 Tax=Lutzomyia longipalpis TaxID=7200 RepID=A0A1B0CHD4_LUTLO